MKDLGKFLVIFGVCAGALVIGALAISQCNNTEENLSKAAVIYEGYSFGCTK